MMEALRSSREAIERYNRELEEKVALRTQQLQETNAAIKEVQEKLLRTTQLAAVGEVAGRTAHELLNPLTAIIGRLERSRLLFNPAMGGAAQTTLPSQLAEILTAWESDFRNGGMGALMKSLEGRSQIRPEQTLLEEDLDNLKKIASYWQQQTQVVAADLDFVQDQAQRIHRIVDRMRELVRSSVKTEVHCHEALEEALQTMSDFMAKHGIALERRLAAAQDTAILNRDELVQIVTNLVRNSFQAIAARGTAGRISVTTAATGHLLSVDIVDNGVGIPEEKRRFLFEQGFTTKSTSEGTGLGLAICRRYAHAFGGEVELLFSEPESRGTCFRITIPLKEADSSSKMAS
jgi:signal transduction histidine kinase